MEQKKEIQANIFFILFAAVLLAIIPSQVQEISSDNFVGARFFPRMISIGILLINAVMLVKNLLLDRNNGCNTNTLEVSCSSRGIKEFCQKERRIFAVVCTMFLCVFLMQVIGYLPSMVLLLTSILAELGTKKWYYYLIIYFVTVVVYCVFRYALYVVFP